MARAPLTIVARMSDCYLVLGAVGPDRKGLVLDVTRFLSERGGNIEDGQMSVLGGEFGVMLLVRASADGAARIERDAGELEKLTGTTVLLRRTHSPKQHRQGETMPCRVTLESFDRAGLVSAFAEPVRELGINIVSIETVAFEAPFSGTQLFRLEAELDVPRGVSLARLRESLASLTQEGGGDIEVRAIGRE